MQDLTPRVLVTLLLAGVTVAAQQNLGYDDTPFLPGGKWRVHDGTRPQPTVVTPPPAGAAVPAPSDAVVLFDGTTLDHFRRVESPTPGQWREVGPAGWRVENGALVVAAGTGNIATTDTFGDVQLHVEWATPAEVAGDGQGRGNSGVFLMQRYEIQVLDSYGNPTYPDGQAGAIYGQMPPLVNASRPPGAWQTYDIVFIAPRFGADGSVTSPARATVLHNGVLVQHDVPLIGATAHRVVGTYTPHAGALPLMLQDHGSPVRFRNIWARRLTTG
ncbi:MAG: DUF1080 domain-containing protein [Vicinamibacterales bacterium]